MTPTSVDLASSNNTYSLGHHGKQADGSESNIYLEPRSPKRRKFKKVYQVGSKQINYQEVNSDEESIGGILVTLPSESLPETSKRSVST